MLRRAWKRHTAQACILQKPRALLFQAMHYSSGAAIKGETCSQKGKSCWFRRSPQARGPRAARDSQLHAQVCMHGQAETGGRVHTNTSGFPSKRKTIMLPLKPVVPAEQMSPDGTVPDSRLNDPLRLQRLAIRVMDSGRVPVILFSPKSHTSSAWFWERSYSKQVRPEAWGSVALQLPCSLATARVG